MSKRICSNCKTELPENARFCIKCGQKVSTSFCMSCGSELPEGSVFCQQCGERVTPSRASTTPVMKNISSPAVSAKKRRTTFIVLGILIIVLGCVAFAVYKGRTPAIETITASENIALWSKAHTSLYQFIGEGMKTFGNDAPASYSESDLTALSGYLNDFQSALVTLASVTPPPEQAITHRALLPIYQEMPAHMTKIRDALLASKPAEADLEWNSLAVLLEQTAGLMNVLSPEGIPAPPVTTPPITTSAVSPSTSSTPIPTTTSGGTKTILPLPASVAPKPDNLLASNAEYFLLYSVFSEWGLIFNQTFADYTQQGLTNNWTSIWIGSSTDENHRSHFNRVGDNWQPKSLPSLPSSIPAKPSNLYASDADYLLMYTTYNNWGYNFTAGFSQYSVNATNNQWTSWWMGSETDTTRRLYFHAAGTQWALD